MGTFAYRLLGAVSLDRSTFEALEMDRAATRQAFLVVLLSSLAAGVGAGGWDGPRLSTLAAVTAVALVTWVAWVFLILEVGGQFLPERQTHVTTGELLRTVGFAAAPGLLQVFAYFQDLTIPVFVASWAWMFAAMVVGIRQALDFSSIGRAILVCALALLLVATAWVLLALVLSQTVS